MDGSSATLLPPSPGPVSEYKFTHQCSPPAVFHHHTWFFLGVSAGNVGCQGAVTNDTLELGSWTTRDVWHCLRCIIYVWEDRSDLASWRSISGITYGYCSGSPLDEQMALSYFHFQSFHMLITISKGFPKPADLQIKRSKDKCCVPRSVFIILIFCLPQFWELRSRKQQSWDFAVRIVAQMVSLSLFKVKCTNY